MTKRKLSLISGLAVSLFAIVTASVSTFAWFQAEANVTIQTSGSSTTITVTKPDDYTFYAYKGNKEYDYNGDSVIDSTDFNGPTGTFANDFVTITNSNISALTDITGFYPGQSFVYCVSAQNLTAGNPISLMLNKFISNDIRKQSNSSYHRYRYGSNSVDINIGWAIDIYSMASYNGSGYTSFLTSTSLTDKFDYNFNSAWASASADPLYAGTYASPEIDKSASPITIYSGTVEATRTTAYIFYRIYFTNNDKSLYMEVNSSNVKYIGNVNENSNRYFRSYESTLGTYYLTGTINGSAVADKTDGYSLSKIDNDHYQLKGVTFAANDTFRVANVSSQPYTYISNASTWDDCGFSLVGDDPKMIKVTTGGTYTVDFYVTGQNNNHVVITRTNNSTIDYDSNCFQGLKFALTSMSFNF